MRIAIIGAGISGLTCASLLAESHDLTVFEANDYIGGHTHTVDVDLDGARHAIDTGFIVFNDRNYPNFSRLLARLGVASTPTEMSFSVRCDRTGLEYNGTSLNGVFAQRRNLVRPSFLRMLRDILRFNREGPRDLETIADTVTIGEYLDRGRYSSQFADQYLLPMGAAIWSCPTGVFRDFPIRFILEFYKNHGLLSLRDRPVWHVVNGGSRTYVEALVRPFRDAIRLKSPVSAVMRSADAVEVHSDHGVERFDEVVFACHSDQALRLLSDPTPDEHEVLGCFPYSRNTAVLHTDETVLPRRRLAWAAWNYHLPVERTERVTVTYNMSLLQHLRSPHTFCVTLNEDESIDPAKVLGRYVYHHPVYTTKRSWAQSRHADLLRRNRTSFCGAYWGNGFHEDGVNSALAVAGAYGTVPIWRGVRP